MPLARPAATSRPSSCSRVRQWASWGDCLDPASAYLIVVGVSAYQVWTPVLDPLAPLLAPAVGGVIGVFSGVYPASRAAQLEPAKALSH